MMYIYVNFKKMQEKPESNTVMCQLMMGIHIEKCIVRQVCHCVNIRECTYTNPDGPSLYGIAYHF